MSRAPVGEEPVNVSEWNPSIVHDGERCIPLSGEVSFRALAAHAIQSKSGCRKRTVAEVKQYVQRLETQAPSFMNKSVRSISTRDCRQVIADCWQTATTQNKARHILHSIFGYALSQGWVSENPAKGVDISVRRKPSVHPLELAQVRCLLQVLTQPAHICCAPAVGMMLWADVSSAEVEKLCWRDVDMERGVIRIPAEHAKNGRARQVMIYPALAEWICSTRSIRLANFPVVPRGWRRRWRDIRVLAGLQGQAPDMLRRTFATCHALHFGTLPSFSAVAGGVIQVPAPACYFEQKVISRKDAGVFWGAIRYLMDAEEDS
ncbi:MAG: hypothetical protein IKJ58_04310 [Akkermansia sp.]|nr:hypothetical protein [Akkermansia sp.]